jgi:RNA polymerase sigma-70 factor (ECF subfamily)
MLLHHARAAARTDPDGRPIALGDQDRSRWDAVMISEGVRVLDEAIARRAPGPFQLQAAIAALHSQAPSLDRTDWAQIAALYSELGRHAPSAVVEVNRAVAVGEADGPLAGLAVLAPVLASPDLANYAPMHTAHAELLERSGDSRGAATARAAALAATGNSALRTELSRRWAEISKET